MKLHLFLIIMVASTKESANLIGLATVAFKLPGEMILCHFLAALYIVTLHLGVEQNRKAKILVISET